MEATIICCTAVLVLTMLSMWWKITTQISMMEKDTNRQLDAIRTQLNTLTQAYINHLTQYHGVYVHPQPPVPPTTQNTP